MTEPRSCDYCDEGNIAIDGWHVYTDPEGIEGTSRIPCAKTTLYEVKDGELERVEP